MSFVTFWEKKQDGMYSDLTLAMVKKHQKIVKKNFGKKNIFKKKSVKKKTLKKILNCVNN